VNNEREHSGRKPTVIQFPVTRVTREEAAKITEQFLKESAWAGFSVGHVYSWNEIKDRRFSPWFTRPIQLDRCWIVYLDTPCCGTVIMSSEIVIVSKKTGEVLYRGSANDEG
jgi:hypothetical protein